MLDIRKIMKSRWTIVIIIVLLAFIVRLFYVSIYNDPVTSDAAQYDALAYNMFTGNGYILNNTLGVSNTSAYAEEAYPSAWRPPGYPLFLTIVYSIFGYNYFPVYVIQALLSVFSGLLIYFIGKKLFNHNIGVFGLIFFSFWPPYIVIGAQLLTETLNNFLVALAIYISILIVDSDKQKLYLWVLLGLSSGYSALVRAPFILFPYFIVGVIILLNLKKRKGKLIIKNNKIILYSIVMLLITLSLIGIWTYRNQRDLGHFIPGTTMQGSGVYFGTMPFNTTINGQPDHNYPFYKQIRQSDDSEYEQSIALTKKGIENMKSAPFKVLGNKIDSLYRIWSMPYMARTLNHDSYDAFLENNAFLNKAMPRGGVVFNLFFYLYVGVHAALVILFILSLLFTKWWKDKRIIIAYIAILYLNIIMFLTIGIDRYVLAVLPIMVMAGLYFAIIQWKKTFRIT